jgi:hypothetical protein
MLFGAVTQQAWCFQALQQIACEKCGLTFYQYIADSVAAASYIFLTMVQEKAAAARENRKSDYPLFWFSRPGRR